MENNVKQEKGQLAWENPFKPEDFVSKAGDNPWNELGDIRKWASEVANARFRELIKEHGKRVLRSEICDDRENEYPAWVYSSAPVTRHTHTAILIMEKEIK